MQSDCFEFRGAKNNRGYGVLRENYRGMTRDLAKEFGVSRPLISNIRAGRVWKEI